MPHDTVETMYGKVLVSATNPAAKDFVTVSIRNFTFEPREVIVKPGGVVNWTNLGKDSHNVVLEAPAPGGGAGAGDDHALTHATPAPGLALALPLLAAAALALAGAGRRA